MTSRFITAFICVLHTCVLTALELKFIPDPPELNITEGVYRINASDTLHIACSGRLHLEWSTPSTGDVRNESARVSDCSGSGLFCSTLTIAKASASETGRYRCSYRGLPAKDGKTAASAYVYVQDVSSPFVRSARNYDVVFIREGEPVVVPCLGSIEDLNVTLFTKFPLKELVPDGKEMSWDNRKGFTVPSHLISNTGVVFCQTQIHNETFESSYYIVAVIGYVIHQLTLTPVQPRLAVGERLVLNCTAYTELNVVIEFKWTYPSNTGLARGPERSAPDIRPHKNKLLNSLELSSTLTVENVTLDNVGEYTCSASSGQMMKSTGVSLVVYEKPFILLSDQGGTSLEATVGDRVLKIAVRYTAYPEPDFRWFKNGQPLRKDDYRLLQEKDSLTIYEVCERDAGSYMLVLRNPMTKEEQRRPVQLVVNVPPHIYEKEMSEDSDVYVYGSSPTLRCTARGLPLPITFLWQWMPQQDCPIDPRADGWKSGLQLKECDRWRDLTNDMGLNVVESLTTDTDRSIKTISSLKIQKAQVHAFYRCLAYNKVGRDERIIFFHVTRGLELDVLPSHEPFEQHNVFLKCKADQLIYGNLQWFWLGNSTAHTNQYPLIQPCRALALPSQPMAEVVQTDLHRTNITLELPLLNVSKHQQGLYVCQVENLKTKEKTCLVAHLALKALQASKILVNLTDQRVNMSDTITLSCEVIGTPLPTVAWTKNNRTLVEGSGVVLTKRNQTLTIQRVKKEDSGVYACLACNSQGCDWSNAVLVVEGPEDKTNMELIVPIGSVVIAMFFWLLVVFVIRSRKRPRECQLKTGYFSIVLDSEDVPIDEQCERLTYDPSKWEFPRERLKLGEPLGRGAFGQVMEAAAFGLEKTTTCTTVAVKMLKEGATGSEYQALMSELKILIHIGHHLNVVNLLGACTKPGGPLMVIVEYCCHGNLSSYLKSKRADYQPFKKRAIQGSMEENLSEDDVDLGSNINPEASRGIDKHHHVEKDRAEKVCLTMEDLISYSFQVAKGMEFLSSRKCIHRDLAARNILLSDNNIVKICDFGLARDIYKDPDYVRKGDARLPLKWMAPETIFDRVYTTQSDVWSFGVLLWEIFSLGATPYPGVSIDETFCRRLKEGTRMRAPDYATLEIYQTMLECWQERALERPTFSQLVEHLGNLLQTSAMQDGKDYVPVTHTQGNYSSEQVALTCATRFCDKIPDALVHYDNAPVFGSTSRSKSKESLASSSSNQTSGYRSGYHSDEADTPVYANEEVILKTAPVKKLSSKFGSEVRYSVPPV